MKHLKSFSLLVLLLLAGLGLRAQCNGVVSTITENFNAIAYGQRPACWNGFYTAGPWTSNYVYNGEYRIQRINQGAAIPEHFMVVLPQSTVKGPLSFDLKKFPNSGNLALEVGTLSNPADPLTFTNFQTINYGSSNALRFTVDFTNYAGTDKYIAFRAHFLPGQGFGFDNLTWTGPLATVPSVLPPKGPN
jgi:hypothetical protein